VTTLPSLARRAKGLSWAEFSYPRSGLDTAPEIIASLARLSHHQHSLNGFSIVDLHTLWRPTVAAYLSAPGRTLCTGMELARAVGRSNYADMSVADWRILSRIVLSLGWKSRKVAGGNVWVAPCAQSQLALSDSANAFS
jgi:hypothetical protein